MVFGIGIDIIEIDRIKNSVEKYGNHFLDKVYTKTELEYCMAKANKYQHLAARFAAKEAVFKALTTGWNQEIGWQNIEIYNEPNGMPMVKLKGELSTFLTNGKNLKISMSHSRDYVTCVAIMYKELEGNDIPL
jgi:holo-[acyl-carrier protein] synthase